MTNKNKNKFLKNKKVISKKQYDTMCVCRKVRNFFFNVLNVLKKADRNKCYFNTNIDLYNQMREYGVHSLSDTEASSISCIQIIIPISELNPIYNPGYHSRTCEVDQKDTFIELMPVNKEKYVSVRFANSSKSPNSILDVGLTPYPGALEYLIFSDSVKTARISIDARKKIANKLSEDDIAYMKIVYNLDLIKFLNL